MSELSIRVTHRTEIDGRAVERTIDIEEIPAPQFPQGYGGGGGAPANEAAPMLRAVGRGLAQNGSGRFQKVFHRPGDIPLVDGHVAVIDTQTGLMWTVESLGDPDASDDGITQEHCLERCRDLRLLGFDDWRLPTRAELVTLIDDTRHDPAIDTDLFPRVKPRWHWTSTPAAWSSASAWFVSFDLGDVGYCLRSGVGFALAVRRAGQ